MPVISRVPLSSGQIPYSWLIRGSQVPPNRKSFRGTSEKNSIAGSSRETTIPIVVRTEIVVLVPGRRQRIGLGRHAGHFSDDDAGRKPVRDMLYHILVR